jgi:hypothetical protein
MTIIDQVSNHPEVVIINKNGTRMNQGTKDITGL